MTFAETLAVAASVPLRAAADAAGKRLWMTEYAGGTYNVTDIDSGLELSTQVRLENLADESPQVPDMS